MPTHKRAIRLWILTLGAGAALAACSAQPSAPAAQSAPPPPAPQFRLTATVQDLMESLIDPSADSLWDSVAYIATTSGVEDRRPRTEEEWKTVRASAVTLIEATNLLSMAERRVSSTDSPPGLGELSHAQIQQRIDASHDAFDRLARNLQDAGLKALAAIDAKDAQGLMDAGGIIDETCEACHVIYWYPDQKRPGN